MEKYAPYLFSGTKKAAKTANTAATVGSLNVGDACKVYGLPAQVGQCLDKLNFFFFLPHGRQSVGFSIQLNFPLFPIQGSPSSIQPSMGATIMNPVLTQQFIGGKLGRKRTTSLLNDEYSRRFCSIATLYYFQARQTRRFPPRVSKRLNFQPHRG